MIDRNRASHCLLSVLILLVVISACRELLVEEADPISLAEFQLSDRTVYIGFTGTKVNAEGEVQCRNYARYSPTDSLVHIYGFSVRRTLATLLDVPVFRVSVQRDSLESRFLDVKVRRKGGAINLSTPAEKSELLQLVCEALDLRMASDEIRKSAELIVVADSAKLSHFEVERASPGAIRQKGDQVTLEASSIVGLANFFNAKNDKEILTRLNKAGLYAFSFEFKDEGDIPQILTQFGLGLEQADTVLTQYTFR